MLYDPAIAFKKKSFRKHFDIEDNFQWFTRVIQLMLEAPTIEITRLLQSIIVDELRLRGEEGTAN